MKSSLHNHLVGLKGVECEVISLLDFKVLCCTSTKENLHPEAPAGCCPLSQVDLRGSTALKKEHVEDSCVAPRSGTRQRQRPPCCHTSAPAAATTRRETIPFSLVVSWGSEVRTEHPSSPEQLCTISWRPVIDQPVHEIIFKPVKGGKSDSQLQRESSQAECSSVDSVEMTCWPKAANLPGSWNERNGWMDLQLTESWITVPQTSSRMTRLFLWFCARV